MLTTEELFSKIKPVLEDKILSYTYNSFGEGYVLESNETMYNLAIFISQIPSNKQKTYFNFDYKTNQDPEEIYDFIIKKYPDILYYCQEYIDNLWDNKK